MEAFPAQSNDARETWDRPRQAAVTTTARLHFGFLDPSGRGARPFGSFGLSLDRPRTRLVLRRAGGLRGQRTRSASAPRAISKIAASCGVEADLRSPDRGGDPAACGARLRHAARARRRFRFRRAGRARPRPARDRGAARARRAFGHRHRHLRARRRRARWRAARGQIAEAHQPPPLPVGMARAPDLRCRDQRARRRERDGGVRDAARFSRARDRGALPARSRKARCPRSRPAISRRSASMSAICKPAWAPISRRCKAGPMPARSVAAALDWLRAEGIAGLGQSSWGPTGFAFVAHERRRPGAARPVAGAHSSIPG